MQSAENIFGQYIKIKNFAKDIWAGFPMRKEKLQEQNQITKLSKNLKSSIFNLFLNSIGFDFYRFLATCKKSEKSV